MDIADGTDVAPGPSRGLSTGTPRLSAATATPSQRNRGIALMLGSSASTQVGAAMGAMALPTLAPVGVVAMRQLVTAVVLAVTVRPRPGSLRRGDWYAVVALGGVFSVMNLCVYATIQRLGLGPAITLEFLGPLAVAIGGSRRAVDIGCALVAAAGVVVLTAPGPTTDVLGIVFGLLAATAWGSYILLNRSIGQRLPGLQGTAMASLVTLVLWVPGAAVWFTLHRPTPTALALGAVCGVLSSVVPYVCDVLTLRRVPAQMFGTITSVNPVWAALAGLVLLHQALALHEWIGIALIVGSNIVVTAPGFLAARAQARARSGRSARAGAVAGAERCGEAA